MRGKRLKRYFYTQPTLKVAQNLLGKFLVRKIGKKMLSGMIVEVEAYKGHSDKASHASRGKTKRTEVMFDKAGLAYVYIIYGMYHCLNVVTEREEYPSAVLIRSLEPVQFLAPVSRYPKPKTQHLTNGPGKLCQAFKIDRKLNKLDLVTSDKLWIEDRGVKIKQSQIVRTKRIGVDYAGPYWSKRKWRFYIKRNEFVSIK